MGSIYEVSVTSSGRTSRSTNYDDNSLIYSPTQSSMEMASTLENWPSSTESEIDSQELVKFSQKQSAHLQLRAELITLWRESEVRPQTFSELNFTSQESKDYYQRLNAELIQKENFYWDIFHQENQYASLCEQQAELQNYSYPEQAPLNEMAERIAQHSAKLYEMKTEWQAQIPQLKFLYQELDRIQAQCNEHAGSSISPRHLWNKVENLLCQEKQNIKNMLVQARQDPLAYEDDLACIPDYLSHFDTDFFNSYVVYQPSVYKMLRIASGELLTDQEILIINRVLTSEEGFSITEIKLLENMLDKEIERAQGKLAQEKIQSVRLRDNKKIENITFYIEALMSSHAQISNIKNVSVTFPSGNFMDNVSLRNNNLAPASSNVFAFFQAQNIG